jgi:MFS family permease
VGPARIEESEPCIDGRFWVCLAGGAELDVQGEPDVKADLVARLRESKLLGDHGDQGVLLVFVGLMVTELLASLDSTVFTTALPTIVGQLHGVDQQQCVLTAYLLTSTIALPIYGKIGDLIGRKGLFLAAIGIFVAGSIVSGFAGDMTWLVIGRAVQGLGGGGLMILSDTIVADVVPARRRGRYMGLIGAVMVLASIAGPLVGGWFTDGRAGAGGGGSISRSDSCRCSPRRCSCVC